MRTSRWLHWLALLSISATPACARRPPSLPERAHAAPVSRSSTEAALRAAGITVTSLDDGIFLAVEASPKGSPANVLFVQARDGTVVFCSSPYDTEATRALVRFVRSTLHPSRMLAINTHFHGDGTGGNEGYAAEGVETYASTHTAKLQAARGKAGLEGMAQYVEAEAPELAARIRATRATPPTHTFEEGDGLTFDLGGESVRVLFLGPAHSADNVVVSFADRGVLFGGCMVRANEGLGNTSDADVARWAASVEKAEALAPRIVVPGHGAPGGPELLTRTVATARAR